MSTLPQFSSDHQLEAMPGGSYEPLVTTQVIVPPRGRTRAGRDLSRLDAETLSRVEVAVADVARWLDRYGETSYDFQTFYAGKLGRKAKALYYRKPALGVVAVAPLIACEAFVPSARRFFWVPQRFPIADAHYAMAFAFRSQGSGDATQYRRAVHFLEVLLQTACPGYRGSAWGYPFDWETINGTIPKGTPLITTLPYVYEAYAQVYALDRDPRWRQVMRSIAEHALHDFRSYGTSSNAATSAYTPASDDRGMVVNASAYRAFLLTKAAVDCADSRYQGAAEPNLNFVLESQNRDGSWPYAVDGKRDFIDHIHTCFVLKALAKIEQLTGDPRCAEALQSGVAYYTTQLFDARGLPIPFAKAPRLTIYRRELYDYAECINLGVLLRGRFARLDRLVETAVEDLLNRWQKPDGSFKSRELRLGWDNVPMHRWAQAQLFRSFCALLCRPTGVLNQ